MSNLLQCMYVVMHIRTGSCSHIHGIDGIDVPQLFFDVWEASSWLQAFVNYNALIMKARYS